MSEDSVRVVARLEADPDRIDEVAELLSGLIEPTREESGCIAYELYQNREDPTDFTFVEEWESDSALEAHLASDHLREALPQLERILVAPPDIRTYTRVG